MDVSIKKKKKKKKRRSRIQRRNRISLLPGSACRPAGGPGEAGMRRQPVGWGPATPQAHGRWTSTHPHHRAVLRKYSILRSHFVSMIPLLLLLLLLFLIYFCFCSALSFSPHPSIQRLRVNYRYKIENIRGEYIK